MYPCNSLFHNGYGNIFNDFYWCAVCGPISQCTPELTCFTLYPWTQMHVPVNSRASQCTRQLICFAIYPELTCFTMYPRTHLLHNVPVNSPCFTMYPWTHPASQCARELTCFTMYPRVPIFALTCIVVYIIQAGPIVQTGRGKTFIYIYNTNER